LFLFLFSSSFSYSHSLIESRGDGGFSCNLPFPFIRSLEDDRRRIPTCYFFSMFSLSLFLFLFVVFTISITDTHTFREIYATLESVARLRSARCKFKFQQTVLSPMERQRYCPTGDRNGSFAIERDYAIASGRSIFTNYSIAFLFF